MIIGSIDPLSVIRWPLWAWQHRDRIAGFPTEASEFVQHFVENSGASVQRIGSSLVYGTPDGAKRVLGFVEQNEGLPDAVDSLATGQAALSSTLGGLQSICLVTLGLSVVTPAILLAQFGFLSRQFRSIKNQIKDIESQLETSATSDLKSGLDTLDAGVAKRDRAMVDQAHGLLSKSLFHFRDRLHRAVEASDKSDKRDLVLYLMRHLSVAICGTARCRIAQEYDDLAAKMLDEQKESLQNAASHVFGQTAGRDPERFLVPQLEDVNLEYLRSLYEQAQWAGVNAGDAEMREASRSATTFFDRLRPRIFRRLRFKPLPRLSGLRQELRDATASIEEANRVLSLRTFLEEARKAQRKAIDVIHALRDEMSGVDARFVAWSMSTPATQ